jgi:hypothetical protein
LQLHWVLNGDGRTKVSFQLKGLRSRHPTGKTGGVRSAQIFSGRFLKNIHWDGSLLALGTRGGCRNLMCYSLLAGGTFTRILNTWHYLRNSHAPVEVHVSECVTCEQHRYFQAVSLKTHVGMVPFSP